MILEAAAFVSLAAVAVVVAVIVIAITFPIAFIIAVFKPEWLEKYHPDYKEGLN